MSAVRLSDGQQDEVGAIFEFWSPSEIRDHVARVGAAYVTFAEDLGRNPNVFNAAELAAWSRTYSRFLDFVKSIGFFASLTISTVRRADTFAAELEYYRELFHRKASKPATGASGSSIMSTAPDSNDPDNSYIDYGRTFLIVAGVGAVAYLTTIIIRTAVR